MSLSALSIRYPRVLAVVLATVIVWGGIAFFLLPRQEEPMLTWRLANVVTRLPGATPERVESLITDVLERYVEEVDQVEHIYSVSRPGVSLLQVELSDEVTNAPPVWQKVRQKLAQAAVDLPEGVIGPDLDDEIMGTFAQLIAVTGESASYRQLKDEAQRLEDELRYLPTTASTALFGVQQEVIQVELDPLQLAAYDLSFEQVAHTLRRRNTQQPSGRLPVSEHELLLEASGEFESDDQVRSMVLTMTSHGRTLRLGDVARVIRTFREPPEPLARINGRPAVVVGVRARQGLRLDRFGDQVHEVLEGFLPTVPPDMEVTVFHDLSRYTRERMGQLSRTLLLSVAFVFLSTAFFLGWRGATVVTAAIPLTGLMVLIVFYAIGLPLDQMSVMAVVMAFGLLVDDAIVVTEQIHRRCSEGVPPKRAAAEEPSRLSMPLTVTTLTTLAAFLPIYLLPGGVGEFVRAIPLGMTVCLVAALLVAVTAIPWMVTMLWRTPHAAASPAPTSAPTSAPASAESHTESVSAETHEVPSTPPTKATPTGPTARLTAAVADRYRAVLGWCLARPKRSLVFVVVVMMSLAALGITLRRDFFSPVQRDQFVIDVFAPQGTAVMDTARLVARIEALLATDDQIESTASFVGRNAPLIFYNLESQETYANHFAQLIVNVRDWSENTQAAQRIQAKLDAWVAGAECCVHILEHGAPFIAPFEVRISGPSMLTLRELGRRAAGELRQTPGVRNVRDNFGQEVIKLVAEVNEPAARRIGVDQTMVADQLRYRLDGLVASQMREGDERIEITMRLPPSDRSDTADLDSIYFKPAPESGLIPFAAVARPVLHWEAASIWRRDGRRTLSVLAYPKFGLTAAQVSRRFGPRLAALAEQLPPGYSLELGGENEQRREAETNLLKNAIYAVMAIMLLLMIEFRSFGLTLMILALLPLSLGGAMPGLVLMGWPLNFMAMMGTIILFGVVVNDAVVLVDGFERRRRAGEPINELVMAGTLERSRHVVITTVTTVAGFLPLALSPSLLWPPLAIVIIGGLSLGTVITLIAIPAAYVLLRR